MYRRLNTPSDLWIAGILSAIFFCLVVAMGGSGGSWRVATPNVAPSIPYSGGMDVSPRPSILLASKSDKVLGLDHGGGSDPAILPDETALPENVSGKRFVAVAQHAPSGNETSGYNARAPPALI